MPNFVHWPRYLGAGLFALLLAAPAAAASDQFDFGGDQYVAGDQSTISHQVANDAFAAGLNVDISAPITGDAHAAGASVTVSGPVSGNVYALGNSVTVSGAVGKDVTAAGATVTLSGNDPIAGNVRVSAGNITLSRPVTGNVLLAAGAATISAPIGGDLSFTGNSLDFTGNARVAGTVTIKTSSDITVPASVAPADRVTIEKVAPDQTGFGAGEIAKQTMERATPGWLHLFVGPIVLFVVGVIWLALFRRRPVIAYQSAMTKPITSFALGVMGLAGFVGLIPVIAITLLGLPLVPIAVAVLILAVLIGYIAGTWFLATRVLDAFGFDYLGFGHRVVALAVGLIGAALLSLLPVLGWFIQLVFLFYGLGGIVLAALGRWMRAGFHTRIADEVDAMPL